MGFREQLVEDMGVFFNCDEFSSPHTINGAKVPVVIDNEELAALFIRKDAETKSLFTDSVLIFVQASTLGFEPVPDQYIDFDGQTYIITDVKVDGGLYAIVLGVNGH